MINIKIKVIDSIMGSGKSTWAHNHMMNEQEEKFIYITPYLNEIHRLIGNKNERDMMYYIRYFREPQQLGDGKLNDLHNLLIKEYNIATTHSLFRLCTNETTDLIAAGQYTLILDEVMDIISIFDISIKDYNMLLDCNYIKVDNDRIIWLDCEYDGEFNNVKKLCENGTVFEIKRSENIQLLAWNFNIEMFKSFNEVYIMTYLFESSLMKYYFEINNIEYNKYCIEDMQLIEYKNKQSYDKEQHKKLINIYDGSLNNIGDRQTALSLNWFKNNRDLNVKLKNNIYNYLKNIVNAKSESVLWTTFKSCKSKLQGKGYTKSFVSCNSKATNEYRTKNNLVYCCNRYISPDYCNYFDKRNIKVNNDLYALSELLQWIWRSCIRDNEAINIYIPSRRMRELLINWLNDENT
jgi:hypothetical protein